MNRLPELSRPYRSHINHFLRHLERQGTSWSQLVPANGDPRPAALEDAVNAGIRDHGLHVATRGALNQAFHLVLRADSGQVRLAPTLPEHTALMNRLPALSSAYRSSINRFLCHLEQQGTSWSQLAPTNGDPHPAALEEAVNTAIRDHGLDAGTRAALNRAFHLVLQGESGQVKLAPTLPAHTALMNGLPPMSSAYRSSINRFLCYLEQEGTSWSQLVPANGDRRPAALEDAVNAGRRDHRLDTNTRAALNETFGLVLRAESGRVRLAPTLPEHTALMNRLPALSSAYRSSINRFLCHLEQEGTSWSQLVPASDGPRPAGLEDMVNAGIRDHGLDTGTRAALNHAFNLVLQGESGRVKLAPTLPEHTALLNGLPQLRREYRSSIKRFLCHLEQEGKSWSQLVPASGNRRPTALEDAVNVGIRDYGLHTCTRAAVNQAFRLVLRAESGQVKLAPTFSEHTALMNGLRPMSSAHRSRINRFLCYLEQEGTSWSQLVPANGAPRLAALEDAVSAGMRDHGLDTGTRAALNHAFGFGLRTR